MALGVPPETLHRQSNEEIASKNLTRIPDSRFNELSKALQSHLGNDDYAIRPRTWFILFQINRPEVMHAFISQGLGDASLPLKERRSLPSVLNPEKCQEFIKVQELVISDILHLESGQHLRLANGDDYFKKDRVLGTGQEGKSIVDQVRSKISGRIFARKRINRNKVFGHDKETQKAYETELKTLAKLSNANDHDHLIRICGTYTDKKYFAMLLEPVAEIDLKEYMKNALPMAETQKALFRTYFGCLAHTLKYLHEPPIEIIHKDIKPANILLHNGRLILTDFGTAYDWSQTGQSMTRNNSSDPRTARYMSPEVSSCGSFHRASDIWSLGVIFLEMLTILRGKSIAEMDAYMIEHGRKVQFIYDNLEAAMQWFQKVQQSEHGSTLLDNEPLAWIKQMLSREHTNRPSASDLCEMIVPYQTGTYCGQCCLDEDSETESCVSLSSDLDEGSETVKPSTVQQSLSSGDRGGFASIPMPASSTTDIPPHFTESTHMNYATVRAEPKHLTRHNQHQVPRVTMPPHEIDSPDVSRLGTFLLSDSIKTQPTREPLLVAKIANEPIANRKATTKSQAKPSFAKDIVKWLAMSREKWKGPVRLHRPASRKKDPQISNSQRIDHFLSSLPESSAGYLDHAAINAHSETLIKPFGSQNRSQTVDELSSPRLQRTSSQEDLPSTSYKLNEDADESQFAEADFTRLIHSSSESDLRLAQALSDGNSKKLVEDLKRFAASSICVNATAIPPTKNSSSSQETFNTQVDNETIASSPKPTRSEASTNALQRHLQDLRGPGIQHLARNARNARQMTLAPHDRLEDYAADENDSKIPKFESAPALWLRFQTKIASEPPTTILSERTRSKLSVGQPVLRWNDTYYKLLPSYCAKGSAGAVRKLLQADCNPGTQRKPRFSPIYNTIRGATPRHTKCLRLLVDYGANVNAINSRNRRPLHYAMEQKLWSGYSTVIWTLLSAGANPNAKDPMGDVPLLTLLGGSGELPKERREALFLLLNPDFDTKLDVSAKGTQDNPLHLALRRKDYYVTEAIVERLEHTKTDTSSLMRQRNSTGFTPLLLAFSIFTWSAETLSNEAKLVKYLLNHGAAANDKDTTQSDTPLHRVVRELKSSVALEVLCSNGADADIKNNANKSALDIAYRAYGDDPTDEWALFAVRRMKNVLKPEHYRPPELTKFLEQESPASPTVAERAEQRD